MSKLKDDINKLLNYLNSGGPLPSDLSPSRDQAEKMIKKEGGCLVKWTQAMEVPNSFNDAPQIVCHVCIHNLDEYDQVFQLSRRCAKEEELHPWLNSELRQALCAGLHGKEFHKEKKKEREESEKQNAQGWEDASG